MTGLDRTSTEVVLRRALELADLPTRSPTPYLERETLAEIAHELDIPDTALAAALAERAVGVGEGSDGLLDRVIGPDTVWARRTAAGNPEAKAEEARQWLETAHGMKSRLTAEGTVVATKRTDLAAKVKNQLRQLQGQGGLSDTRRVSASVVGFDDGEGAICVVADVGDKRNESLLGGAAVAGVAGTAVVLGGVLGSPFIFVALPVAAGLGAITSRLSHQKTLRKISESVEETADGLARGEDPPSVYDPIKKRYQKPWKQKIDPPWD